MVLSVGDCGDGSGGDVAFVGGDHLVVDLDQQGANEPDHGFGVGKDLNDIGTSFQFPVESFDWVVRPDLGPMGLWERRVGEQVVFHGFELGSNGGSYGFELVNNSP